MFCRGTRRKRVETGAGQAVHRTEAAERANRGKSGLTLLPDPSPAGLAPLGYRPSRRACRDAGGHDQRQWRAPRETAKNARRPARRVRRQARRHQGDGDLAYPSRPYRQCRAVPAGHALCSEGRIRMAGRRRRAALQSQSPGDLARGSAGRVFASPNRKCTPLASHQAISSSRAKPEIGPQQSLLSIPPSPRPGAGDSSCSASST